MGHQMEHGSRIGPDSTSEEHITELAHRRVGQDALDICLNEADGGSKQVEADQTEFRQEYEPGNPSADAKGYVKLPNVNGLVEALDMREAQRAYEANLNVIESSRAMQMRTLDLLKK